MIEGTVLLILDHVHPDFTTRSVAFKTYDMVNIILIWKYFAVLSKTYIRQVS